MAITRAMSKHMQTRSKRHGILQQGSVAAIRCMLLAAVLLMLAPWASASYPTAKVAINTGPGAAGGSGTITISFNGYSEQVTYGPLSTPSSIASGLAAKFSGDPQSALPRLCTLGVCAHAKDNIVTFELDGVASFGPISTPTSGTSFQVDTTGWPNTGLVTPSLDVVCTPNPVVSGSTINCTATLPPTATGTVTFSLDQPGTLPVISTLSSGVATASFTIGAAGDVTLTADYSGDAALYPVSDDFNLSVQPTGLTSQSLYSFNLFLAANGDIASYNDTLNGTQTNWTLDYDQLNRLIGASSLVPGTSNTQYLCWTYDNAGNRTAQAVSSSQFSGSNAWPNCIPPSPGATPSHLQTYNANNQLVGTELVPSFPTGAYDASGNLQMSPDGTQQFLYDAEGRLCGAVSMPLSGGRVMTQYIYDAEGQRIAKGTVPLPGSTAASCNSSSNGFTASTSYAIGPNGSVVTEMDGSGNWVYTNVPAAGQLIATYANDGAGVHFHVSDWLGSRRVQANYLGVQEQFFTNLPYGDTATAPTGIPENHFTGKERDGESGLDYFGARYYGSTIGRFVSPDPLGLESANPANPQSLNLYAYVVDNPLNLIDPTGLMTSTIQCTPTPDTSSFDPSTGSLVIAQHPDKCVWVNLPDASDSIQVASKSAPQLRPFPRIPKNLCSQNTPSLVPHGLAIIGGAELSAGAAGVNGTIQGSGGHGWFHTPERGGVNSGWFSSFVAAGRIGPYQAGNVPQGGDPLPLVAGAAAGVGAGLMVTNATNVTQLGGDPFPTLTITTPVGSVNFSYGGGIWTLGVTVGPGEGAAATATMTPTKTGDVHGPC